MTMSPTLCIPHTLALLFFLKIAALVATWLVPQGFFAQNPETGRVLHGSHEVVAERKSESRGPRMFFFDWLETFEYGL